MARRVYISGHSNDVDQKSDTDDLVDMSVGLYSGQPVDGVADRVLIRSTSKNDQQGRSGAHTVELCGLESRRSVAYTTERVTLRGTTAVSSDKQWYRVVKLKVLTAGKLGVNAGNVLVCRESDTSVRFIDLPKGQVCTRNGVYTVPAKARFIVGCIKATAIGRPGHGVEVRLLVRGTVEGAVYVPKVILDTNTGCWSAQQFEGPHLTIAEGSDIKVQATNATSNNLKVQAMIEGLLIRMPQ